MTQDNQIHIPVLLQSTLELLQPKRTESYLDLTAGYGGHAREVFALTQNYKDSTLVDRDINALETLNDLKELGANSMHSDFKSAVQTLVDEKQQFDLILLDLGVSSPQLDRGERGFSIKTSGPLDMRMDTSQELNAASIVNLWSKDRLAQIFIEYGEEKPSVAKRYADAIIRHRPLLTTEDLANVITEAHIGPRMKIHPATRVFQAIRMVVNDEIGQIQGTLPGLTQLLRPGGRLVIISFHSLEDRLVKKFLHEQSRSGYEATLRELTKKPIDGSLHDAFNPRSRSAKLRAAVKI